MCSLNRNVSDRVAAEAGFQSDGALQLAAHCRSSDGRGRRYRHASTRHPLRPMRCSASTPSNSSVQPCADTTRSSVCHIHRSLRLTQVSWPLHLQQSLFRPRLAGTSLIMTLLCKSTTAILKHDRNGYPPPLEDYCTLWEWVSFSWLPIIDAALLDPSRRRTSRNSASCPKTGPPQKDAQDATGRYCPLRKIKAQAEADRPMRPHRRGKELLPKRKAETQHRSPDLLDESRDLALDFILNSSHTLWPTLVPSSSGKSLELFRPSLPPKKQFESPISLHHRGTRLSRRYSKAPFSSMQRPCSTTSHWLAPTRSILPRSVLSSLPFCFDRLCHQDANRSPAPLL